MLHLRRNASRADRRIASSGNSARLAYYAAVFRFALANLTSRPARTILATLGLAVAIAGMVGLFSVREGIQNLLSTTFEGIDGSLVLARGAPVPIFSVVPLAWGEEIEALPEVGVCNAEAWARVNVINGKTIISPPRLLMGTDIPSRLRLGYAVYKENIIDGRFLDERDIGTFNTVICKPIADEFGINVGDTFEANGETLTLVGVASTGSILLDVSVVLDEASMRTMSRFDEATVSNFYVEPADGVTSEQMKIAIEDHFQGRTLERVRSPGLQSSGLRGLVEQILAMLFGLNIAGPSAGFIADSDANDEKSNSPLDVTSTSEFTGKATEFTGDLDFFLAMLTAIGVVIAVLSIVNTMLMSVAERTTEFGVLRANGWSRRQIVRLITSESAVIGLLGGIVGVIAGYIGVEAVNAQFPNKAHLYASPGLLAFSGLFSIIIGTLGGLYPAWRASRLSPIDAIRRT